MTEREPFFDSCDDFERSLLRSVRQDAPAAGAASKTIAALGLDPAAVAATTATSVVAGALGARGGSALAVFKGLGVGLLVGSVAIGVAGRVSQSSSAGDPRPPAPLVDGRVSSSESQSARSISAEQPRAGTTIAIPVASASTPKQSVGAQPPVPRDAAPVAEKSPPPSEPPMVPVTGPAALAAFGPISSSGRVAEPPSALSIAEQVKIIDQARSALKDGRASQALGLVSAYAERWPNGALTIEAVIVRIEAELALHDRNAAERDARAVISALPGSRYVTRVRELFSPPLADSE
ncbi:MAG TPA: hypothetical protein VJV79_23970 [Polyangiaceae bacterium]|nr:hypothetical protein [Polyangiaceae bacterium]